MLQCLYLERLPPPSCPTTLKMKLNLKQRLIKSFYLKLLVPVKHWGRETQAVSDWRSVLQASNCVHAGFILALLVLSSFSLLQLFSYLLLTSGVPFILPPPSCPHLLPALIFLFHSSSFFCSFKILLGRQHCDLPHAQIRHIFEGGKEDSEVLSQAFLIS